MKSSPQMEDEMNNTESFRSVVIFGGAGFIGSNLAHHLLTKTDAKVHIFDNLSRHGVRHNLEWLRGTAGKSGRLQITIGDVRETKAVEHAARQANEIYHFAAQVAVTTSVTDPRHDFEVNVGGTFNILEAARKSGNRPFVLFTSTNKVYGDMAEHALALEGKRYRYVNTTGISEAQPLDFHSPYGCSKGAADQYVHDYARIYGIPTVVFRMSCIAGERQFGTEDQGWVAHFLYSVMAGAPLTIYGDGKQVRDVLYVQDLLKAFAAAREKMSVTAGQVYNVGGGAKHTTSLLELIEAIRKLTRREVHFLHEPPRPGDQLVYVTDCSRLERDTGWRPLTTVQQTLERIYQFRKQNAEYFPQLPDTSMDHELVGSVLPLQRTA
ncbi:MAG TPA: GDP-mannose 4,6-dehydratase [Terriglobales bacterium]